MALSGDMVSGFMWDGRKGWFAERCNSLLTAFTGDVAWTCSVQGHSHTLL